MICARLRLFGEPSLTAGPDFYTNPVDLPQPVETLLVYLALHPHQPIDRRKLAFVLWADTTEAGAMRNLRQHLHRLRQLLASLDLPGDLLVSQGRQLQFKPTSALWIDVHQFERQINDQRWQIEAIELYRADLLSNYEAEWVQPHRTRLREQYLKTLRYQITIANMQRNYPRALHYARRLLQANPLRESSHRIYMECLYFSGQRAQALQQFAQLKSLLKRTLTANPMPQTVALYRQIQNGTLPADLPPAIASTQQAPQTLETITQISNSFIGRRKELAALDEALARAMNGYGQFILIEGGSGLGKTRLLHTWQQARAEQMLVFSGQGQVLDPGIPGAPVIEALGRGWSQIDCQTFPASSPWPETLQAILLELNNRLSSTSTTGHPVPAIPPIDKMGQFILTLASRADRPVGLFIDDLHNADDATWQLLAFLGRRCAAAPLLLVGAYQSNALSSIAARLLHSLQRHRQLQIIELWPLSPADTAQLAAHLWRDRQPLDEALVKQVYRITEGNPFFITEYVKTVQPDQFPPATTPSPPKSVQAVINTRLNQLPPAGQALLAIAAAIGRNFNFRVLAGVTTAFTENQVLEALEAWLERGLVLEQSDGYTFQHEQIQLTAYASLSPVQRRQIHRAIARALSTLSLEPRLRDPAQLAHHYLLSDAPEQALPYLVTSGKRALSLNSLSEAQSLAKRCLTLLTEIDLPDQLASLTRSLAETLYPSPNIDQTYATLDQIVEIWLKHHQPDNQALVCL